MFNNYKEYTEHIVKITTKMLMLKMVSEQNDVSANAMREVGRNLLDCADLVEEIEIFEREHPEKILEFKEQLLSEKKDEKH